VSLELFRSGDVAMQLLDALKTVVTPWRWFGSQYVAVQGQYTDDGVYLDPQPHLFSAKD